MRGLSAIGLMGVFLLACRGAESEEPGRIDVTWTGADTGEFKTSAFARWCAGDSLLEIMAVTGDSGLGLALFAADTLRPGVYPVGSPGRTPGRPGARVGLRWLGENLISGYYSLDGVVTIDSGPEVRGKVEATLKGVTDGAQLNLMGTFRDLTVIPSDTATCRENPVLPDTSVR